MRAWSGELLARDDFESLHWLISVIRRLRPDVATNDNFLDPEFFQWLVVAGIQEYAALRESNAFRQLLNRNVENSDLTVMQSTLYRARKDVREIFPLPEKREEFLQWFSNNGVPEYKLESMLPEAPARDWTSEERDPEKRPFGVNLIGYAFGQLGIGEELRMLARSLKLAGIPFTIINFPPGEGPAQNDRSMAEHVGCEAPYRFNIFCLTALEQARFLVEKGTEIFRGRYNIGHWSWELSDWPEEWIDLSRLVDEVWIASDHVYHSLAPVCDAPVVVMPLPMEIGETAALAREDFGLPKDAYIFAFSFDINSTMRRKNPEACLKAFQMAFPASKRNVALVIKAHKPKKANSAWDNLKEAAAKDRRIIIIEETLQRPDLLALYKCCDCFVSLHRAEGFGLGIAEAIMLGLDVITTGYSGNMDFCRDNPAVRTVNYTLAPLKKDDYPYWEGKVWAEPDIRHAAELMRKCAGRRRARKEIPNLEFTLENMGKRYRQRLEFLGDGNVKTHPLQDCDSGFNDNQGTSHARFE